MWHDWSWGWGMMMGGGLLMLLFWILVIVSVVVLVRWVAGSSSGGDHRALAILKERYAKGEITKEQFEQMKRDIAP